VYTIRCTTVPVRVPDEGVEDENVASSIVNGPFWDDFLLTFVSHINPLRLAQPLILVYMMFGSASAASYTRYRELRVCVNHVLYLTELYCGACLWSFPFLFSQIISKLSLTAQDVMAVIGNADIVGRLSCMCCGNG
jgi:hypothetical protein